MTSSPYEYELTSYQVCNVYEKLTSKQGRISTYTVLPDYIKEGADIRIVQGFNVFHGWIDNIRKVRTNSQLLTSIDCIGYLSKINNILVSEVYEDELISDVIKDLFSKYAPQFEYTEEIQDTTTTISIVYNQKNFRTAIENLAEIVGYRIDIDESYPNTKAFSEKAKSSETIVITPAACHFPSTSLYPDASIYPC